MENLSIQRLDKMGNLASKQTNQSEQSKYNGQIVNVTYGHNGSGKMYSYYGTNKRTGDIVTPKVTNPKSGKTYRTLAVVRSTHNIEQGKPTIDFLQGKIAGGNSEKMQKPNNMKHIGKTDQKSLPGYYQGWDEDAKAAYDLKMETLKRDDINEMQKLSLLREIIKLRKK